MTLSAHFIRSLGCNIATYNSPAPLALNSVCALDGPAVRACVCVRLIATYIAL